MPAVRNTEDAKILGKMEKWKTKEANKLFIKGLKRCSSCNTVKEIAFFTKRNRYRHGFMSECRMCINKRVYKKYGISFEIYQKMSINQQHKCLICNKKPNKKLVVDHCHSTGKVRGLLCYNCNTGLGLFMDNIKNLNKAIQYLNNFSPSPYPLSFLKG